MFGWTSSAMTTRYQHVVPELLEEANRRLRELLWGNDQQSGARYGAVVYDTTAVASYTHDVAIRWAESASKHGIDHDEALHAITKVHCVEQEF
jgi:hypothetical protein